MTTFTLPNTCPDAYPLRLRPAGITAPDHAACVTTLARRRARRVARARRCAPLAQYQLRPAASKRPAGKAAIAALRADGCRAQPATTREARPRSAQPGRSLRGGSLITVSRPRAATLQRGLSAHAQRPAQGNPHERPAARGRLCLRTVHATCDRCAQGACGRCRARCSAPVRRCTA